MNYLLRYIIWNKTGIRDYKKFPSQDIQNGTTYFSFPKDPVKDSEVSGTLKKISYRYRNQIVESSLEDLLKSTGTTSFIIIKDDNLLFEEYFNNYNRDSVNTSFSIAKTFTSTLIGIAIDEGTIGSVEDKVVKYIPELKGSVVDTLAIKHLLSMSSGIRYNSTHYPWGDEPKSYYYPNLKKLVLKSTQQEYDPGLYFKYVNYNFILLGIILERTTKTLPSLYLQEKLWKPLEMEFPATWSTDSRKHGFVKMESGINARSIDFAKFGRLFLNGGLWNNIQVIPEKWIIESTSPPDIKDKQYYITKNFYPYSMFFKDQGLYYKYGWWGLKRNIESYDYLAIGVHGQFIYICPQKQIIIVRNGKKWGNVNWWPAIFKEITEML